MSPVFARAHRRSARRAFLKSSLTGVAAAPILLSARDSGAQTTLTPPPSPPTTAWAIALPDEPQRILNAAALPSTPGEYPNTADGECGRNQHERFTELTPYGADFCQLHATQRDNWIFNPAYPPQRIWGFEGETANGPALGPVIVGRYGRPMIVRLFNGLPNDHTGFGTPEVSLHLHNMHTPSESDGFPGDYFSTTKAGPTLSGPGYWMDHFYPNVYAGLDEFGGIGDPREALGTLWYHDHTLDFTGPNTARGLAGPWFQFDAVDSDNERDPTPGALRLPSHPFDYPLLFQDKRFNANGIQIYNQFNPEGTLGDKVTVNGVIEPVLRVERRKYRFRLINAGPTRFYQFFVERTNGAAQPFAYIANDGNLLPAPLQRQSVKLGMAERADIVIDFSQYPLDSTLFLVNRLRQSSTRKPGDPATPGVRVLKFHINRNPAQPDVSVVPTALRPLRPITAAEIAAAPVRRWVFSRDGGMWTINDRLVDVLTPMATIQRGAAEIWELVNDSGGWSHPVHIHFEEGRILETLDDGVPVNIPPFERGRKDVFVLGPNMTMRVFLRFRDFFGKYVMHCHNIVHEDHAMMVRFDIQE